MTTNSPTARRRLDQPEETGNRAGCLFLGAVLGIIVGIMFALYGLPPILRSIYGEESVAMGATFDGDGRVIRVVDVTRSAEPARFLVTISAETAKSWDLGPGDAKLEISTQDEWVEALPPDPADPRTSFDFVLGQEREMLLRFPAPTRVDAEPVALHLAHPRVRFDLQEEAR